MSVLNRMFSSIIIKRNTHAKYDAKVEVLRNLNIKFYLRYFCKYEIYKTPF